MRDQQKHGEEDEIFAVKGVGIPTRGEGKSLIEKPGKMEEKEEIGRIEVEMKTEGTLPGRWVTWARNKKKTMLHLCSIGGTIGNSHAMRKVCP